MKLQRVIAELKDLYENIGNIEVVSVHEREMEEGRRLVVETEDAIIVSPWRPVAQTPVVIQ